MSHKFCRTRKQAETTAEVAEEDEFHQLATSLTDPLQHLMAMQLKQNQEP